MAGVERRLFWAPRARADLIEVWRHHAQFASPDKADDVLRKIQAAARRSNHMKMPGRLREELQPGLRSLYVRPYLIFFRLHTDRTEIARVLHERRDAVAQLIADRG